MSRNERETDVAAVAAASTEAKYGGQVVYQTKRQ